MKRSDALRPLSRDHHQALRVAQLLRRAEDPDEAASVFLQFWRGEGSRHFQIEEEVLLPLWGEYGTVDEAAAARLFREHVAIRQVAASLETGAPSIEQVRALGEQLADHVRFEERELFALIEADLAEENLERLAQAVSEAEHAP